MGYSAICSYISNVRTQAAVQEVCLSKILWQNWQKHDAQDEQSDQRISKQAILI